MTSKEIALPAAGRGLGHVSQATAIEQSRAIAEVQAAILVAQQCPRDMVGAWEQMKASCGRLSLASRAFYSVPNRGTGPSVHLARELARIWGNIDYGVKELSRDDELFRSEVQAYAWDQQTNVRSSRSFIVPHARMAKGERKALTDLGDIYLNNQNVGARAVRESIFTVLPADFVAEAQELCRATIQRGDGKPLPERVAAAVAVFGELGVTVAQLETRIGRKRGYWTPSDLADLTVLRSSLKRGELSIEEAFPTEPVTGKEITGEKPAPPAPAKPEPEPPTEEPPADEPVRITAATQRQLTALHAALGELEVTQKEKHGIVSKLIQRRITSTSELTRDEASNLIDLLKRCTDGADPLRKFDAVLASLDDLPEGGES